VFLLNRADGNRLFKYFEFSSEEWFIFNDQVCCHGFYYDSDREPLVLMLEMNSSRNADTYMFDFEDKLRGMYSTAGYECIYSKKVAKNKKVVTLEFSHY
jgi:hypothetical protein